MINLWTFIYDLWEFIPCYNLVNYCILKCLIVSCLICTKSIWYFTYIISAHLFSDRMLVFPFYGWVLVWFLIEAVSVEFWFGMDVIALFYVILWFWFILVVLTLLAFTSLIDSINRLCIISIKLIYWSIETYLKF